MDFLSAQDGPITHKINGVEYTFPVWETQHLIPVLSRLRAKRLAMLQAKMAAEPSLTALQRTHALYQLESEDLNPLDAHNYFMSIEGVDECLVESLVRGGHPREAAKAVIAPLRFTIKTWLAVRVANIFEPAPGLPTTSKPDTTGRGLGEASAPEQPPGIGENPTPPASM